MQAKSHDRAFSYIRFSSRKQERGDSIRRQTAGAATWAAKHGIPLDNSLHLSDCGVSAFRGRHRDDKAALGGFIEAVQSGRVPSGSYLIVESLDRLSREEVSEALQLLLSLINSGIRVVQLQPVETVYEKPVDTMRLVMAIMELSRGNSESAMKSKRVGERWAEKKKRARETREAMTAVCPAWLRIGSDGKYEAIPSRVAVLKRIFRMARDGNGITRIMATLNKEGVKAFKGGRWAASTIGRYLTSRAVLGEGQPGKGSKHDEREKDGDVIKGYFPQVITDEEFHAVRAGLNGRSHRGKGRPGLNVNPFRGLMRCVRCGGVMQVDAGGRKRMYVCYEAKRGGCEYVAFPCDAFTTGLLGALREIKPGDVLPASDSVNHVEALRGDPR